MKSIKTLIAAMLLTLGATSAMAQATYTDKEGQKYEFKKHFFLDLQGGAQYTLGEAKFKDLISPNVQLGLGYQFCPVFAIRLQANAWQSKGGWNGYKLTSTSTPETKTYKYNYVAPGLDFMFNLSNLFCGWNPNRVFNVSAFLGGGANIAFKNDEANDLAKQGYELTYIWDGTKVRLFGRGGIDLNFRLSDAVSFMIEGNANVLSDHYNSKKAGNADWYFNALAGFRINLGKTYKKVEAPVIPPVVEPVKEDTVVAAPEPVKEVIEPLRKDIFFTINSTKIVDIEDAKVAEIADYLTKYPSAKVTVTGYADAGTGTDAINDKLAAKRADIVVNQLKTKYNVSADRISYTSKGSREQPFAENDKNRVSVCIAAE
jgi:outer membrane protein OmpA-like peptidoglycan-associated protein